VSLIVETKIPRISRVLVLGQDIYALGKVRQIKPIKEQKSFQKDKLITNSYIIDVQNDDDYFSVDNNSSIFKNNDWRYSEISVYDEDDILVWDGLLIDVERDQQNKLAKLVSKNTLFKFRESRIEYVSTAWETGAEAFKNLCDSVGFDKYNLKAVNDSVALLQANNCYLKVNMNREDNLTFHQAIEKIAWYSAADAYNHSNNIYFVHWKPFTAGIKFRLTESDLKTRPKVKSLEREMINDYSIGYQGDRQIPATDSNSDNIGALSRARYGIHSLPEMRSGDDEQIVFKDKVSATYIGNTYQRRTHKNIDSRPEPLTQFSNEIPATHDELIDLETFFSLTLSDEDWIDKEFEVFETEINKENDEIKLVAVEAER